MTKRKSGMPDDNKTETGLTSLCNTDCDESREAALKIEIANKRAQRYETVTLLDLSSWPTVVAYNALSKRLQEQILEYYTWTKLRTSGMCYQTEQGVIAQQFEQLQDCERDALAHQLCNIHTVIEYFLRSQVLPEYIKHHITGGEQTVHWESLVPGSATQLRRQLTLKRMEHLHANDLIPGARGKLLDFYDWRLDQDDTGMLHLLHRDLPSASRKQTREPDDEEEDTLTNNTATRSQSTIVLASGYVRAMHTAIVLLGREAHPRSILCPLTSAEWKILVNGCSVPENLLQGDKVTPAFNYSTCGGEEREVNSEWNWLQYRTAGPFYRDQYLSKVHFAVRAMTLARLNKPDGSLATLHRECHRVVLATRDSTRAGFEHVLTVVNSMLQNTKDLVEPDAAAIAAIQAFRPGASISAIRDSGQLLRAEVRRQLSLYRKEMLAVSRRRRNTMAVAANLDSAGLDVKQAQGRLPKDLTLITVMVARLWQQVFEPVWTGVVAQWLRAQKMESSVQSYLSCENFAGFAHFAEEQGLTQQDMKNLRTLLQLDLSFLRSQVWESSLVSEFNLTEHAGCKLYEFRTSRSFKTAGKPAPGSLPSSTKWPLSIKTSALVHTLLHLTSASNYVFPGTSRRAVSQAASKTFAQLGFNWCGIPRLGSHSLRTYYCCKAVSNQT
jgi:hypothetical protein